MQVSRRSLLAASPLLLGANRLARAAELTTGKEFEFKEVTNESEKAVEKGTKFLMTTMGRDGGCGVDVGQPSDIGCTSMVGLSLMSQGNTAIEGQKSYELRQIRGFLLKQTENMPSDDITSVLNTQLQRKIGRHAHSFFAALCLSQIVGEGSNPMPTRDGLRKIIKAIVGAQTSEGNWKGQSWAPTLGTVMGWVSLRAADFAGIKVGGAPEKVAEHLIRQMQSTLKNRGGGNWMHTLYKNATGIRVLYAMKREKEQVAINAFKDVVDLVTKNNTAFTQAGGEEFLAFHLITETMLQKSGEDWKKWYPVVRDKLIQAQNQDGSWAGAHCITSRTFCTAAACLVLTAPYRYLPISQP